MSVLRSRVARLNLTIEVFRAVLKRVPSAERSVMRSVLQHTKTRAAYACGK